jgi:hypothetical protein
MLLIQLYKRTRRFVCLINEWGKRCILLVLIFTPLTIYHHSTSDIPMQMYAWWGDGTVESSSIFMNLPKSRRDSLVSALYEENYDKWIEDKYSNLNYGKTNKTNK